MRKLLVFTRYPESGTTKTRLIPALGERRAAHLQRQMTIHTVDVAARVRERIPTTIEVWHDGGDTFSMRHWLGSRFVYRAQGLGHLGERMSRAIRESLDAGADQVVIVGTDCPEITAQGVASAYAALEQADIVLGPAVDGGYYLIGLRRACADRALPGLFAGIPWGTDEVLDRTVQAARRLGLSYELLDLLDDVDRVADLPIWEQVRQSLPWLAGEARISVIIPVRNEGETLPKVLATVQRAPNIEVVVVDGGSHDDTVEVACAWDARVLTCESGRAAQMNLGAANAAGDVLLFLHGDTQLPEGYAAHIRRALVNSDVCGGAFELEIDLPEPSLRFIERVANWRSRRWKLPYGDQAFFVRAEVFRTMGGYREMPIMEDFDFIRRLGKEGSIEILPVPILTSGRRWRERGVWRTTVMNQACVIAYVLGISPARIARWYRRRAGPRQRTRQRDDTYP